MLTKKIGTGLLLFKPFLRSCTVRRLLLISTLFFSVNQAFAGSCGAGKVTQILAGGYNSDDLIIKIDYSANASTHNGTEYYGRIRFRKSRLSDSRLTMLQTLAISAFHTDTLVYVNSHTNRCDDATEINIRK